MSRLSDYPYPQAFKPGKTFIMSPVTPFRVPEGELDLGRPFPQEDGRPVLVNPYSMGAWDLPPDLAFKADPKSQWSKLPMGDEAYGVVYLEGWAFACLSVWSMDHKSIARRAGDLEAIGLAAEIGKAQLLKDCAWYAPRKVVRHFVAMHLKTGTVVGDDPAVCALLMEVRNRNHPRAEWVSRVGHLWQAVGREDAADTLAALVRSGDGLAVSPADGVLETFESAVGRPSRDKTTLDVSPTGDLTVSSEDGTETELAKVSAVVTGLGWAFASVDRAMVLDWEPADTKKMAPDLALLAQLKAALLAHCALEALIWATLDLRGGTDSTLTRWVEVQVVDAEDGVVEGAAAPVQTTIMGSLAALRATLGTSSMTIIMGDRSETITGADAQEPAPSDPEPAPEEPTPPARKAKRRKVDATRAPE